MSVLVNFAMFPTDKGASVSPYVAQIEKAIRDCGFPSQLTPMSTVVETETLAEALSVIQAAHDAIASQCDRLYISATIDVRKGKNNRMQTKIESVESKIVGLQ